MSAVKNQQFAGLCKANVSLT